MKYTFCLCLMALQTLLCVSQKKKAGPIIEDFGKVSAIAGQDYPLNTAMQFKVVFDIMNSPEDPSQLNTSIETAARFLNMHAQNGLPPEQMKVVLVVHNKASKDICTNATYQERYGVTNPNSAMVEALLDAGAEFIFCGQSSVSRNFPKETLLPRVKLALSAMTALIQLQEEGYHLIKF